MRGRRNRIENDSDFLATPAKALALIGVLRKEVIQPQVPLRLPCYDFTPVADLTVVGCLRS
jgi:hypothetical protein